MERVDCYSRKILKNLWIDLIQLVITNLSSFKRSLFYYFFKDMIM